MSTSSIPFLQRFTVGLAAAICVALSFMAAADVPARSLSGTTLEAPADHAALGRVYYVRYPSHTGQITFTSDAPIEIIVGTSSRVVGYAVVEERDGAPTGRLLAGGFRLPVRSLDSGIPMRNEHMQQPNFLDVDSYPDITFEITGSDVVEVIESNDDGTTYSLALQGDMMIRGVVQTMEIPAQITLMPASDLTRNAGPGDLLALRCTYTISRGDFGVAPQFVSSELVDTIRIDQRLIMTTTPFDERLRRSKNPELAMRLQRIVSLIRDMHDLDAAVILVETLTTESWGNGNVLNSVVWNALTTEGASVRRFPGLRAAAERASTLIGATQADPLDTVARVHYELGDLESALAWQHRAVEHRATASDPDEIVSTLNSYEREAGLPLTEVQGVTVEDLPQGSDRIRVYVGAYVADEGGFEINLLDRDGRLHAQPPGQSARELLYQGDHTFRLASRPQIKIMFAVEDQQAISLELHQGGNVMKAKRVGE